MGGAVGHPEQFAQRTFAEETERITRGAAGIMPPGHFSEYTNRPIEAQRATHAVFGCITECDMSY